MSEQVLNVLAFGAQPETTVRAWREPSAQYVRRVKRRWLRRSVWSVAHDATAAIQAASDAIHAAGGGTLIFPPGKFHLGSPVELHRNVGISDAWFVAGGESHLFEIPSAEPDAE